MPGKTSEHVITVTKYVVPLCMSCGRTSRKNDLPDVCDGMDEIDIKAELFLEEDDDIPEEYSCFRCSVRLDLEGGFWTEVISPEDAFGLGERPPASAGRRASQRLRDYVRKASRCRCAICERELMWNECTIDHVRAWSKGGTTEADNLIVLCDACNQLKGDQDWGTRLVVSPALLYPDRELRIRSPEEEQQALDYLLALFECLDASIPLRDQRKEIAKRLRSLRRER